MILTPEQPTLALHARNAAQSAHPELWRGLVGAWVPALKYQGQRLIDASGNTNAATFTNGTQVTVSRFGHSIALDGVDDYLLIGKPAALDFTGKGTISAWIRPTAWPVNDDPGERHEIYSKGFDGSNEAVALEIRDASPRLQFGTFDGIFHGARHSLSSWVLGDWRHVAGVYDGQNWLIFVDAALVASSADATGILAANTDVRIGAYKHKTKQSAGGRYFEGNIGGVCVFDRALTPANICTLYTDPLAPFRLRDDTALVTAAMFGGTPSAVLPPPLLNMQMTGSF